MALRSISLCSGIGGLDLGLSSFARTVCYVEGEAYAASVLVSRMAEGSLAQAPIWSDLTTFDASSWRGVVEIVVGGYPCQPFSFAGKRLGEEDPRHLWPHVFRVFQESGAQFLFCENVRGHLSKGFSRVLGDLAEVGCDVRWGVFSSAGMGAPHKRERLFFLANAHGWGQQEQRSSGVFNRVREAQRDHSDGCPEELGYSHGSRLEERQSSTIPQSFSSSRPPGPSGDWSWVPESCWPTEPYLRGVVDGASPRVDRLRALGNAVDPGVAAEAFRWLSQ